MLSIGYLFEKISPAIKDFKKYSEHYRNVKDAVRKGIYKPGTNAFNKATERMLSAASEKKRNYEYKEQLKKKKKNFIVFRKKGINYINMS